MKGKNIDSSIRYRDILFDIDILQYIGLSKLEFF